MWADFVQAEGANPIQYRQADGADTGVELGDPRAGRDARAYMVDDEFSDFEIALAERAGRIVDGGAAKVLDHARRSMPVQKLGTENGVALPRIGIEPQAMQLAARAFADQIQTARQRLRRVAVGNEDDLGGLRVALHYDLQITREAQVGAVRVAGHARIHERTAHNGGDTINERMMYAAMRDVYHAVGALFEEPDFGRIQAAAKSETAPVPERSELPGDHGHVGQGVSARQVLECTTRGEA
jgi:hypothetical protein